MRTLVLLAACGMAFAQGTIPIFKSGPYTLGGRGPGSGTTTIPVVLVPLKLTLAGGTMLDAASDVPRLLRSPVFANYQFPSGGTTQYIDAMFRSTFAEPGDWHTLLGKPQVTPLSIDIPVGYGYVLTSKREGRSMAVVDWQHVQQELFRQLPKRDDALVIAFAHNTTYYSLGDATVCCSWGAHGVDKQTGTSFVLASYLERAPSVVTDSDVQPITQQLALLFRNPLHDPQLQGRNVKNPGNSFPGWLRFANTAPGDQGMCAGSGAGSMYFFLEPTNHNPKNNIPASPAFTTGEFHLQNVALLPWYTGPAEGLTSTLSFPDASALTERSKPCGARPPAAAKERPLPRNENPKSPHKLIGYWFGGGGAPSTPLHEIAPQWDVVSVAFAVPQKDAPEGTMQFTVPPGRTPQSFKAEIAEVKKQGRTVLISLGGGGQHFTLADPKRVPNFVASVQRIVEDYGFEGVDIDFESPSLSIAPGDTDFRSPTTPSIVNLIDALKQLRQHFGPKFQITLVPEGTQIPAGYPSYGGQFGSYLPILHALRDAVTFVDVQDYNTPPLQGLDGEIYQVGTVDYHAAVTELLLQGFPVGGNPKQMFPPMAPEKVAVGFFTTDAAPEVVSDAMRYLMTGKAADGTRYKLRKPDGYPGLLGSMFWTINADATGGYKFSNVIGPQLHQ